MACIKVILCATLLALSATVRADFQIDLDEEDINIYFEVLVLGDIGVGDTSYVNQSLLCVENRTLKIPKNLPLENDRSEYGRYFKVKRLPRDVVSFELIPSKSTSKKEEIVSFIKRLVNKQATFTCELFYSTFGYDKNDMFVVSSIEGAESLKALASAVKP